MRSIVRDVRVAWSVVCLSSVTFVYCAKTAHRIEMPFGGKSYGDTSHIVLKGCHDPPRGWAARPPNWGTQKLTLQIAAKLSQRKSLSGFLMVPSPTLLPLPFPPNWGTPKLTLQIAAKPSQIEQMLQWTRYRKSPSGFQMVPSPTP